MLIIRSIGFNSEEKRLLEKQLEIVGARINHYWRYEGEGTHGDLVLAKQPTELPDASSTLVLVNAKNQANYRRIDAPVRLNQLSEILTQTGDMRYSHALSIRDLLKSENEQSACFALKLSHGSVYFNPRKRTIHNAARSTTELLHLFEQSKSLIANNPELVPSEIPAEAKNIYTYKSILWLLAKEEIVYAKHHWKDNVNFKISSWPNLQWVDENSSTKNIAMLFSRFFISVSQVAKATESTPDQVKLFLHCCDAIDVKILSDNTCSKPIPVAPSPKLSQQNTSRLSHWLKNKIFSILNNAN